LIENILNRFEFIKKARMCKLTGGIS
jgi:hypothetical protein